jgi:hypothetical protein
VKTATTIALVFATALSGSAAAYAQTEPTVHHHYQHTYPPHHSVHHHYAAHGLGAGPAPTVEAPAASHAEPFGLALPHIAPYPDNKGDEDALSEDPNDCNKTATRRTDDQSPAAT